MKAWRINELGDPWKRLVVEHMDSPPLGQGQVRIQVEATDLNFADILQCQGRYQVKLKPPFSPGMNSSGSILAVGEGVDLEIGQRVVGPTMGGFGGYASESVLLAEQCQILPASVDCKIASAIHVTYGTAWFALHQRGNLQPGETVLVLAGAGGVGSAAIELAKVAGCWVVAAAGGSDKTNLCKKLGADETRLNRRGISISTTRFGQRTSRRCSALWITISPGGCDFSVLTTRRSWTWAGSWKTGVSGRTKEWISLGWEILQADDDRYGSQLRWH